MTSLLLKNRPTTALITRAAKGIKASSLLDTAICFSLAFAAISSAPAVAIETDAPPAFIAEQFKPEDDSVVALPVIEAAEQNAAANSPASILAKPVRPTSGTWTPRRSAQGTSIQTTASDNPVRPANVDNSTTVLNSRLSQRQLLRDPFSNDPAPTSVLLNKPENVASSTLAEPSPPSVPSTTIPYVASNLQPPVAVARQQAQSCDEKTGECRKIWDQLQSHKLSGFSREFLDITPPLNPDHERGSADARDDLKNFAGTRDIRSWNGRHGGSLAEGRLLDYRWGRVVIESAEGQHHVIAANRLSDADLCYLHENWGKGVGLPNECRLGESGSPIRNFTLLTYSWKASGLCHKPLYFEEVQLERYGHSAGPCIQPVISGAHFFMNIAILPYKMGIHPPHECIYALGYYRPGDCAPYMLNPIPISVRGGLLQAGAVVGGVAIIP